MTYFFPPPPQDPSSREVVEWGEGVDFEVLRERAAVLERTQLAQVLGPLSLWARARVMAALGDLENAVHYFHLALEAIEPGGREALTEEWESLQLQEARPREAA